MKAIRFRTKIIAAFAVGLVVIVAACGGGTSATPQPTPTPTLSTATPQPTPTSEPTPTPTPLTNRPPTADFTIDPPAVPRGDNFETVVTYTATGSDPDGDPLTYEWRFTGGRPATASGPIATTTFPGLRPYASTLTVSDGKGGTITITKTVPLG